MREWALRKLRGADDAEAAVQEEVDVQDVHEEERLAIACLLHVDPSLTKKETAARILKRAEVQQWSCAGASSDADLEQMVKDTMLTGEQDKALKQLAARRSQETAVQVWARAERLYEAVL